MNRLLVLAVVAIAALLAFHHPWAPPAAAMSVVQPLPQTTRKGHPSRVHAAVGGAVVYVVGAVPHPGLYRVADDARIDEAVRRAGGFLASADPASVDLAERVNDGEEIRVLRAGEAVPRKARQGKPLRKSRTRHSSSVPVEIDLNAADVSALAPLPGIGETLAERIVEFRNVNGPFASLDELADVAGMTQRRVDAIAQFVTIRATP